MTRRLPTPYDGSSQPFRIGAKRLDLEQWIDPDAHLEAHLAQKRSLFTDQHDVVFVAEDDTLEAQQEALNMLVDYLPDRFPALYSLHGDEMLIGKNGLSVKLNMPGRAPLETAALLVQEDLVIMRNSEKGWRLVAAALCFPSSWRLREKFGLPINEIHAHVPDFEEGTRNAQIIGRMFNNTRTDTPMIRWNWSIYPDDELFHPHPSARGFRTFADGDNAESIFLRVERQTLRRMEKSGDILFTVRVLVDPLSALEAQPDAATLAASLANQLMALTPEQLDYKGLTGPRDQLVERLGKIA